MDFQLSHRCNYFGILMNLLQVEGAQHFGLHSIKVVFYTDRIPQVAYYRCYV